jgi:hypothetical protein
MFTPADAAPSADRKVQLKANDFTGKEKSVILRGPRCASIEEAACTRFFAKDGDLPFRGGFYRSSPECQ